MNQSILFPDEQVWNVDKQVIEFNAMHSGLLINCSITMARLKKLSGATVVDASNVMELFCQTRFDIEEIAEEMIEDERFNDLDQIEIT